MQPLGNPEARVSVIIPALNEVESIGQVVRSMPWGCMAECVVLVNGSPAAAGAAAAAAGARVVTSPRGYGIAMHTGVAAARAESDVLVMLDGDGSDDVSAMPELMGPVLRGEADFVIGSRIRGVRAPGSMLGSQVFAAYLISGLVRVLYRFRYTDMGPFRAIRRNSLEAMRMGELTFGWNLEMQIKAVRDGLRIVEIPVNYGRRIGGVSKVSGNLKASFQAGWRILGVFRRVRRSA